MQETRCPECDQRIKFRDDHAGRTLKCPACQARVKTAEIPSAPAGAAPATAGNRPAGTRNLAYAARQKREAAEAKDTRLPLAVHTTLVGAITGACWGLVAGLLCASVTAILGYNVIETNPFGTGGVLIIFLVSVGIAVGFYAVSGALIGVVYGLSGSFYAAMGTGVIVPMATLLGGVNLFTILLSVVFALVVCKAIETESFS